MIMKVISIKDLSKIYRLGVINRQVFINDLQSRIAYFLGRADPHSPNVPEGDRDRIDEEGHFWALKDVSFDVQAGETVGVIGKNGAGKSTLLKILSRITMPSQGEIHIRGRIASLLEVGTGFHADLTGRENVFMNGLILGMRRNEIHAKFDSIVSFAEMSDFIDTPVKRYSSGMNVRLAFAVAAHLDPEILIIDEVLAVGDAGFQRKCFTKMGEIANQGRTILFVSHNMSAINRLCSRVVWIEEGRVVMDGPTSEVIPQYLRRGVTMENARQDWPQGFSQPGVEEFKLLRIWIESEEGLVTNLVENNKGFRIRICYAINKSLPVLRVGFVINTTDGIPVCDSFDYHQEDFQGERKPGIYEAECSIPAHFLNRGTYYLSFAAAVQGVKTLARAENALTLNIEEVETQGHAFARRRQGFVAPLFQWTARRTGLMEAMKDERHQK
jgi:lipopolysaccharide transport system ATP-binding protein